jgi:hypothetical protein
MKLPRRKVLRLAAVAAMLCGEAGAQGAPLIGTWTSALNQGTVAVIYLTLTIAPDGRLRERLMNRQGVFYDLLGSYQFDPGTGTFSYIFTDYEPKQLCSPVGCQPVQVPQGQVNVPGRSVITFANANFMVGHSTDGTVMNWLRAR